MTNYVYSLGQKFLSPESLKRVKMDLYSINPDYLVELSRRVEDEDLRLELKKLSHVLRRIKYAVLEEPNVS